MASQHPGIPMAAVIERQYELKVFCTNWECERVKLDGTAPNGFVIDPKTLAPDLCTDELEARLVCQICRKPGKLQVKAPPFNTGAGAGFGTAGQWPREPISIPTPPDRPDTPEMKWNGKHRARRRRR